MFVDSRENDNIAHEDKVFAMKAHLVVHGEFVGLPVHCFGVESQTVSVANVRGVAVWAIKPSLPNLAVQTRSVRLFLRTTFTARIRQEQICWKCGTFAEAAVHFAFCDSLAKRNQIYQKLTFLERSEIEYSKWVT
jgi:hypothetical protein